MPDAQRIPGTRMHGAHDSRMDMPLPRTLRRFRASTVKRVAWAMVAILIIALLWWNGFHNIGTAGTSANASCIEQPASTEPIPPKLPNVTADQLPSPRSIQGPTTAYTDSQAIAPITDAAASLQQLPARVESSDGVETVVTDTSRILAINQNGGLAAAVIGLGFGCNLVGRDIATDIPTLMPGNDQLPVVTQNGHELNAEAILQMAPSVVITDASIGPYDVQVQLRRAGIPVVMVPVAYEAGIHGVSEQIRFVAEALGVAPLGDALADRTDAEVRATIAGLQRIAPADLNEKPRVVFLYLRGSIYYWFGIDSGADSLIQSIGARDVASEVGFAGMAPASAEALVQASPDVILVMSQGLESVGGIDEAVQLPGIAQTPAGQNKRFVDMSDFEIMSFGPRTAAVIAALGVAVYAPEHVTVPEGANA